MFLPNSFDQRQPPTPTRTPTSQSFGDVFKTPKFESSFYDPRVTWNTADPNAASPNFLKTPRPLSFETHASKDGPAPSPLHLGRNLEAEFLANTENILATPDFSILQVDHNVGIGSDTQALPQVIAASSSQSTFPVEDSSSFRSASNMQTPPPTTTSASKRQGKKVQLHQDEKSSKAPESRRKSVPLLPKPSNGNSQIEDQRHPQSQLAPLDFSPNVFGPSFDAPATAPPQSHKVFWESQSGDGMNFDFADLSATFEMPKQGGLDPFVSNHPSVSSSQVTMRDSFLDFENDDTPMASFAQSHLQTSASEAERVPAPNRFPRGVDPSLLFSSPGKLSDTINGSLPSGLSINQESLQPYAYQVQEARREKAYSGISKSKKRRKPSVDSPAVKAALETLREAGDGRPAVRRSMTDTAIPRHGQESGSSRTSSAHGRSSPLKRIREDRKTSRVAKQRTSIALTIDENGRARAEARVINDAHDEGSEDAMEVDSKSASTQTESESSSEQSDDEMIMSFATQRPMPKLGRFTNSASHSQKSSYTSFYSSSSHPDTQPSLPELKSRPPSGSFMHPRLNGVHPAKPQKSRHKFQEAQESEAETVLDSDIDDDNAQSQLRKAGKNQRKGSEPKPKHHLYSPLGVSTSIFGNDHHQAALSSISPTTVTDPDLPTPTSGTSGHSDSIRCHCHSINDEGQMIQW